MGVRCVLEEVLKRVEENDPACGEWEVRGDEGKVWVVASSLALGALVQIGGVTVEDATLLRKDRSEVHINMAELDAVLRGANMALAWKLNKLHSSLIRRRVNLFRELVDDYNLDVNVNLISSKDNLADLLTRIPSRWMRMLKLNDVTNCAGMALMDGESILEIHKETGHIGVKRTLHFVRKKFPTATKEDVQKVIWECEPCQSIDPAPVAWTHGKLEVNENWKRLLMDITHYRGENYFSLIYCGPSRSALWRQLPHSQGSIAEIRQLQSIFCERGALEEILTDNGTAFRSEETGKFLESWGVRLKLRAAYCPSGNGIIERNHRTVKRVAKRSNISILEAVYWYNVSIDKEGASPMSKLYNYAERVKRLDEKAEPSMNEPENSRVGMSVWLKPPEARCVTKWRPGTITRDVSEQVVEVDGMPRYVKHIRPRSGRQQTRINKVTDVEIEVGSNSANCGENMENTPASEGTNHLETGDEVRETEVLLRRSNQERRIPLRYSEGTRQVSLR